MGFEVGVYIKKVIFPFLWLLPHIGGKAMYVIEMSQ